MQNRSKFPLASKKTALLYSGVLLATFAGSVGSALAQDSTTPQSGGVEEIIVTAQRTSQNIQQVPVAVTAYSNAQLARSGVTNMESLVGVAPNLQLRDVNTTRLFNIRGSVSTNFNPAPESPVAVYNDDIYHGVPAGQLGDYFDVDRVELLRGPQGTLFGRNSTGGLVQVVSRAPTDQHEGYAIGSFGSFGSFGLEGAASGPLSSTLKARVAMRLDRNDGFQKNGLAGGPNWASKDHASGRIYLVYKPSETFGASLIASVARNHDRSQGASNLGAIDPASVRAATVNGVVNTSLLKGCTSHDAIFNNQCVLRNGGPATSPSSYVPSRTNTDDWTTIYSSVPGLYTNTDIQNIALKMNWNFSSGLSLQSTSTFEHILQDHWEDNNGTGFKANDIGYDRSRIESNQFTQELILRGAVGPANVQAGGYYLHSLRRQVQGTDNLDGIPFTYPDKPTLGVDSIAAFVQADVQFTPQLKGVLGGRYTQDSKSIDFRGTNYSTLTGTPLQFSRADKVGRPTGRAALEYHPSPVVMFYASVATGFSAAEYKLNYYGNISSQRLADPETNVTYELGEKATLWDGRAILNVTLFQSLTRNKQGSQLIPDPRRPGVSITDFGNYGDVLSKGVELEATVRPVERLTMGLNGAYTDTSLHSNLVLTRGFDFKQFAIRGNSMVATPKWSFYAYGRATAPAPGGGEFSALAAYRWQSRVYWNLSNNPLETEDPYGLARFELGWTSPTGAYEIAAFVDNAFNRKYSNFHGTFASSDSDGYLFGKPRWWGARLKRNF